MDQKTIRILAVDDNPVFRQGIASLIADQADMALVAEASNGREAIQQFRTHRPDVTLMDLQMPELSGLDATIAIRNEFPEARIIESWRRHYNTIRPHASLGYKPPAPEVFVPAFAAWPAALRQPAPPATLAQPPALN